MSDASAERTRLFAGLRRDLGRVESYAAILGILVGAGIFRVTGEAYVQTGPSLVLGYLILAPVVLSTSIPYAVFLSTPLGRTPGGEYAHIAATFGNRGPAFLAAWLKLVSYLGAAAFLAQVQADYLLELHAQLTGGVAESRMRMPLALASLLFFFAIHTLGARWFGALQVAMCAVLGIAIAVLVVPGLFAVELANYRPFLIAGPAGLAAALPPLFFAYAGFESLAHTAGEVKDSTRTLPRIFLRGIAVATGIFLLMSIVALGVLPGERIAGSVAPMAEAASAYLPVGAAMIVTVGGILAVATSLNATMFVPARLLLVLSRDGLLPPRLGEVHPVRGTPTAGLVLTFLVPAALLVSGQLSLALNIAVFALLLVYLLHSYALLRLPARNPSLFAQALTGLPRPLQIAAALASLLSVAGLIAVQLAQDLAHIQSTSWTERIRGRTLTCLELCLIWSALGLALYSICSRGRSPRVHSSSSADAA
jgi:amino acid transporter